MASYLKQAKQARAEGDFERAGDLYLLASRSEEAFDAFVEGGLFRRAAQLRESEGCPIEAADLFSRAGDHGEAARLYAKIGDLAREAAELELAGQPERAAARLKQAGMGAAAAAVYQRMGSLEKAAEEYLAAGDPHAAAELFAELFERESSALHAGGGARVGRLGRQAAQAYVRAGMFDRAAAHLLKLGLHEHAAACLLKAGQHAHAAREFRRAGKVPEAIAALEQHGGDDVAGLLAELYLEVGKPAQAGLVLQRAHMMVEAAAAFLQADDIERAASLYMLAGEDRKAAELFRRSGMLAEAGQCHQRAGMYQAACSDYEDAGRLPDAADMACRAYDEMRAGAPVGRAQLLGAGKRAADLCLRVGRASEAAAIYGSLGFAREAAQAYEQAGQLDKAGDQLAFLEDFAAALHCYERAGIEAPLLVRAAALAGAGRPSEAARLYEQAGDDERALELFEEAGEPCEAARLLEKRDDHARAASCYERGGAPERAAEAYLAAGRQDEAAACFARAGQHERAAALHDGAGRKLPAAQSYLEAGNVEEALRVLQKIEPEEEGYKDACLALGDIFAGKGLLSLAVEKYYKGLDERRLDASVLPFMYRLAGAYEELRRPLEARSYYERILSIDYAYKDAKERYAATFGAVTPAPRDDELPAAAAPAPPPPVRVPVPEARAGSSVAPQAPASTGGARFQVRSLRHSDDLGTVSHAWDRESERPVLLRRFDPAIGSARIERLRDEARASLPLRHESVVTVLEVGDDDGVAVIAMEHVDARLLRQLVAPGTPMEPSRAATIVLQVAQALEHAHAHGVIHRNLSPDSVLLPEPGPAKVFDFGLARRVSDLRGRSDRGAEHLCYLTPEQILGRRSDARSDVYGLGLLFYLMLVGRPPFQGEDVLNQHLEKPVAFPESLSLPPTYVRVVTRALAKDPGDRFQGMGELIAAMAGAELCQGAVVDGRYEIQACLGSGTSGSVYRARDRELGEDVALKVLPDEETAGGSATSRIERELKLARTIIHPNVVRLFHVGRHGAAWFASMELVEGPTLETWMRDRGAIDLGPVVRMVKAILAALQAAHDLGIVHGNVHPRNVLLAGGVTPRIVDFGISRAVPAGSPDTGLSPYMAPEQAGKGVLDRRVDIYAVGVVMYVLMSGRLPYAMNPAGAAPRRQVPDRPAPLRVVNPSVPEWLEVIVTRCLQREPTLRYQTVAEVLAHLDAAIAHAVRDKKRTGRSDRS